MEKNNNLFYNYNEVKNELFILKAHIRHCRKFLKNSDNSKYRIYWNVNYKYQNYLNDYFDKINKLIDIKYEIKEINSIEQDNYEDFITNYTEPMLEI